MLLDELWEYWQQSRGIGTARIMQVILDAWLRPES